MTEIDRRCASGTGIVPCGVMTLLDMCCTTFMVRRLAIIVPKRIPRDSHLIEKQAQSNGKLLGQFCLKNS